MKVIFFKDLSIFLTGGMIYYFMEILTRDYSHYSMIICGGLATLLCGGLDQTFSKMGVLIQMIVSAVIITELEFFTGCIVNIILGYNVWDYSDMPFNLMGQICLSYSVLWMLLSIVIIYVDDVIRSGLFGEKMPVYKFI